MGMHVPPPSCWCRRWGAQCPKINAGIQCLAGSRWWSRGRTGWNGGGGSCTPLAFYLKSPTAKFLDPLFFPKTNFLDSPVSLHAYCPFAPVAAPRAPTPPSPPPPPPSPPRTTWPPWPTTTTPVCPLGGPSPGLAGWGPNSGRVDPCGMTGLRDHRAIDHALQHPSQRGDLCHLQAL